MIVNLSILMDAASWHAKTRRPFLWLQEVKKPPAVELRQGAGWTLWKLGAFLGKENGAKAARAINNYGSKIMDQGLLIKIGEVGAIGGDNLLVPVKRVFFIALERL